MVTLTIYRIVEQGSFFEIISFVKHAGDTASLSITPNLKLFVEMRILLPMK